MESTSQTATQYVAKKIIESRWLIYAARLLVRPVTVLIYAIILIIISIYIASSTSYKTSFGLLSTLLIIGTIAFLAVKFIPNPTWTVLKPVESAMYIIEELEESTGQSIDTILNQIANGIDPSIQV